MTEHTVRSFSQDLEELSGDLARMGGLAEDMLSDALHERLTQAAQAVEGLQDVGVRAVLICCGDNSAPSVRVASVNTIVFDLTCAQMRQANRSARHSSAVG